jgi:hypothetical protein
MTAHNLLRRAQRLIRAERVGAADALVPVVRPRKSVPTAPPRVSEARQAPQTSGVLLRLHAARLHAHALVSSRQLSSAFCRRRQQQLRTRHSSVSSMAAPAIRNMMHGQPMRQCKEKKNSRITLIKLKSIDATMSSKMNMKRLEIQR